MKIKVSNEGEPQYIELQTLYPENSRKYGYHFAIMINSFNYAEDELGFTSEDEAFQAGAIALYDYITNHVEFTTQKMSDGDKEMVMDFFNQIQILNRI